MSVWISLEKLGIKVKWPEPIPKDLNKEDKQILAGTHPFQRQLLDDIPGFIRKGATSIVDFGPDGKSIIRRGPRAVRRPIR